MSDVYIFYYVVKNSDRLYKNLKSVKVSDYGQYIYVKLIYNCNVFKYFYVFQKLYESEEYFYNMSISENVEVQMKLNNEIATIVKNMYNGGLTFIPNNLLFHTNEKVLTAFRSQGFFIY